MSPALKLLRVAAKLSLQQVGRRLGKHESSVSRIEAGRIDATPYLEQLAAIYGVSEAKVRRAAREVRKARGEGSGRG